MNLTSKTQDTVTKLITDSQAFPLGGNSSNNSSYKQGEKTSVLKQFQNSVDSNSFYEVAELVSLEITDPQEIARCAELASQRQPGGAFYRAKLWAQASKIFDHQKEIDKSQKLKFSQLCTQIGINSVKARGLVTQGQALLELEAEGIDTGKLRQAAPKLFQYAQRQKGRMKEYFTEALDLLDKNPASTYTQIHRNWCKKNGSVKANLDIIKPSDWWAFSHPKWKKEEDFSGSIPGEVYANALYYFAPHKGVAVDAMAGSGMLKRVYDDRDRWQKDSNFKLKIHLFDLYPRRHFIQQHDARNRLPIKADWIFIDPSYYGQSSHLFDDLLASAESYQDYLVVMQEIITSLTESLNENGRLCVFLPKWSGFKPEDPNHDVPSDVYSIAVGGGLSWLDTAYVSRGRQQEPGSAYKNNMAKRDRRMRSDTCVLNVFEKRGN
ncbi:hypothetical protein PMG71_12730 [Roseofilum sp. BLCC_M154]|uniref:DNA methylase N-4/N-6 domain-containing protein n=1 Tax=Roseofilum acuticapitatum BLCC-M154 TaxID=3022444 RepID=A0ABT7ATQ9_9CYAN|nr:hypothetical protein [Roseofilum acuticapitatum]MDJ1170297.1 hypothetical protein [Roseofilum acuticapitatum BLCC-M154]